MGKVVHRKATSQYPPSSSRCHQPRSPCFVNQYRQSTVRTAIGGFFANGLPAKSCSTRGFRFATHLKGASYEAL